MASKLPQSETFRVWVHDVIEIKELFGDRKYRRCVARCDELLATAVHPIHRTFLNFYQALSYESLGVAAHRYSSTKLPLLAHAKNCFNRALESLPQPFTEDLTQQTDIVSPPLKSPACATLDIVKRYQCSSPITDATTISPSGSTFSSVYHDQPIDTSTEQNRQRRCSSVSSACSDGDTDTGNKLVVRTPLSPRTSSKSYLSTPIFTQVPNPFARIPSNHKARLSLSLSSNHFLLENLVPSPLFRRISSPPPRTQSLVLYNPVRQQDDAISNTSGSVYRGATGSEISENDRLSTTSEGRALPPLPFNHRPHFEKRGSRHVLVPTSSMGQPKSTTHPRATAIQTLVAKFEGKIQNSMSASLPVMPITPITPRFRMIQDAFAVKGRENQGEGRMDHTNSSDTEELDEEPRSSQVDITPQPKTPASETTPTPLPTILRNQSHSSSAQNTPYTPLSQIRAAYQPSPPPFAPFSPPPSDLNINIHLTSFRTSLTYHLTSVTARIDSVTKAQEDHRAKSISRSMSFWSFDVDAPQAKGARRSLYDKGKERERVGDRYGRGRTLGRDLNANV